MDSNGKRQEVDDSRTNRYTHQYRSISDLLGETVIQKVEFNQGDGAYSKSFSVTYKPQSDTKPTIESLTCNGTTLNATEIQNMMSGTDKCVTFTVSPWINDNNTIPEVTGTATENGSVTVTKATVLSPECVATVKTQSGIVVETYLSNSNLIRLRLLLH